jgi:hypothetical protein
MKLTFRTIKGATFNVDAEPATTVGELKSTVESSQDGGGGGEGAAPAFPRDCMKLVYKGKVLDDDAKAISEVKGVVWVLALGGGCVRLWLPRARESGRKREKGALIM